MQFLVFKTEVSCAEVYVSIESRIPSVSCSYRKHAGTEREELNQALGTRTKKSTMLYNGIKSHAASSTTFSEATGYAGC
jgi:hypothetical protein